MPLYFIETRKDGRTVRPEAAIDLPDIDATWEEATAACGKLIRDLDGSMEAGNECTVTVQDEFRNRLRTLVVVAKSHKS
ncbi:MAG: hypothetical protein Q7T55_25105 [Solirubrobacteraceae bacterium]|nr:hypothetical protein [Solirubrobacteraceae bacterium]